MVKSVRGQKNLVLSTLGVALFLVASFYFLRSYSEPKHVAMVTEGHPLIGNPKAKIGLMLIEDFHCHACQVFLEEVFPDVQSRYLTSGKAYCIYVPIALFPSTKPLANAALAVYHLSPAKFLPYIHGLFEEFSSRILANEELKELVMLAERIGGIDLERLTQCIEARCFYDELDQNLEWAKRIMGNDFGIPALYINGIETSTGSFEAIEHSIDQLLEQE
jgi:protein-disulfide isomerase